MKHLYKIFAAGLMIGGTIQVSAQQVSENGEQLCITPLLNYTNLYTTAYIEDGSGTISDFDSSGYFNGTIDYEIDSINLTATERINGGEFHYHGFIDSQRDHMFVISTENYLYSSNTCMKLDPKEYSLPISDEFWGITFKQTENYGVEVGMYSVAAENSSNLRYSPVTSNFDQSELSLSYRSLSNGILIADDADKIGAINTQGDFYMLADRTTSHQYGIKKSKLNRHFIQGEYYFALWGQICSDGCMPRSALVKITISNTMSGIFEIIDDCYGLLEERAISVNVTRQGLIELRFSDSPESKIILAYSPDSEAAAGIILEEGKNAIIAGFRHTGCKKQTFHHHKQSAHCRVDRNGHFNFNNSNRHNLCLVDMYGRIVYQTQSNSSGNIPAKVRNGLYKLKTDDENGDSQEQNILLFR